VPRTKADLIPEETVRRSGDREHAHGCADRVPLRSGRPPRLARSVQNCLAEGLSGEGRPLMKPMNEKHFEILRRHMVDIRVNDGSHGWAEHAPYDEILVTAAADEPHRHCFNNLRREFEPYWCRERARVSRPIMN
jgi:hypothetical protein